MLAQPPSTVQPLGETHAVGEDVPQRRIDAEVSSALCATRQAETAPFSSRRYANGKASPTARFHPQNFTFTELLPGLVICEAPTEDPHSWSNAEANEPAFLVYLGYNIPQERDEWIARLRGVWKIDTEIMYRAAKRVSNYWYEIKIREMQRYSDPTVFDLDYLSESEQYGLDFLVHMRQMELEAAAYEEMMTSRILKSA